MPSNTEHSAPQGGVVEQADTRDSSTRAARREGSTPSTPTTHSAPTSSPQAVNVGTSPPAIECMCGAQIRWQPLPPGVLNPKRLTGIWLHVESGQQHCYVDENGMPTDNDCKGEPA